MSRDGRPIDAEVVSGSPRSRPTPAQPPAPIRLELEIWPEQLRARAGVQYADGRRQDIEISSPVLRLVLAALRGAGVQI